MQVERDLFLFALNQIKGRLQWRTGEEHVRTYLLVGDNSGKLLLIPNNAEELKVKTAKREACVWLASWVGNGCPRRRSVAGLRGWSATLGLRHGPDSYGRQQWGIFHNGRKPDGAIPRGGRRIVVRKLLFLRKKQWRYLRNKHRLTLCQQPR